MVRLAATAIAACVLASCASGTHDGGKVSPPIESTPHVDRDAFWIAPSGTSYLGPGIPDGTWAVVGGRRVMLRSDGTTRIETDSVDQVLTELAAVPSREGADTRRTIAQDYVSTLVCDGL